MAEAAAPSRQKLSPSARIVHLLLSLGFVQELPHRDAHPLQMWYASENGWLTDIDGHSAVQVPVDESGSNDAVGLKLNASLRQLRHCESSPGASHVAQPAPHAAEQSVGDDMN